MSFGAFTYGSIATLTDYRTELATARKSRHTSRSLEADEMKPAENSSKTRTEKAMLLAGLGDQQKGNSGTSQILASAGAMKPWSYSYSYKEPNLNFGYNFVTLKQIFSYRDAVLERYEDKVSSEGEGVPSES